MSKMAITEEKVVCGDSGRYHSSSETFDETDSSEIDTLTERTDTNPIPRHDLDEDSSIDTDFMFAKDVFKYYKTRETRFVVNDYMDKFPDINRAMRAIVIDWMVQLQDSLNSVFLSDKTLHMAVKVLDLFLDRTTKVYGKESVKMIASCAVFIASKFDEQFAPLIDDFFDVDDESFTRSEFFRLELQMLGTIGYDLDSPLSYRFLRCYANFARVDKPTSRLAHYVLETSLMFFDFSLVPESQLAGATFLLALKMMHKEAKWDDVLWNYSGYEQNDIVPLMWELNHMLHVRSALYSKLDSIFCKYVQEKNYCVAAIPFLEDVFPQERPIQVV